MPLWAVRYAMADVHPCTQWVLTALPLHASGGATAGGGGFVRWERRQHTARHVSTGLHAVTELHEVYMALRSLQLSSFFPGVGTEDRAEGNGVNRLGSSAHTNQRKEMPARSSSPPKSVSSHP